MNTNNPTPYTDQELTVLIEEYITQQRAEFTLRGLYAYIVYWAMEEKRIAGDQLSDADMEKVNGILKRIVKDGRIRVISSDGKQYVKQLKQ